MKEVLERGNVMLQKENALIMVIDLQEKLMPAIDRGSEVVSAAARVLQGGQLFDLPVIWMEQYPKGLGRTVGEVAAQLKDHQPIEKVEFNALDHEDVLTTLKKTRKKQVVLVGIETHICLLQTAKALVDRGYDVYVVEEATGSRSAANKERALATMRQIGVEVTGVESMLYELLGRAGTPLFIDVLALIK